MSIGILVTYDPEQDRFLKKKIILKTTCTDAMTSISQDTEASEACFNLRSWHNGASRRVQSSFESTVFLRLSGLTVESRL